MNTKKRLAKNIHADAYGTIIARKLVNGESLYREFPPDTDITTVQAWLAREVERLSKQSTKAARGTLAAAAVEYLKEHGPARLTKATRTRRTQQLAWWCAQAARLGAPVLSVKQIAAGKRAEGVTLGQTPRTKITAERLQQILAAAFPTVDADPAQGASTHNLYRLALWHLFATLDRGVEFAINPLAHVPTRQGADPGDYGIDMRLVREILKHAPSKFGRDSAITQARVGVLAWVDIRESQLMKLDPARDFHDMPDATRDDILAGAITVTIQPHLKGRKNRRIPRPSTMPLTPWGVEAMRAFVATPGAAGKFSMSPIRKYVVRGCVHAQAALAKQGVAVDLSAFTPRHFRHSIATAKRHAAPGLVDRNGDLVIHPGVVKSLGHANARTSGIYTQAAIDGDVLVVHQLTMRWLEAVLAQPLTPPPAPLTLVASKGRR
jgi:hypothetical protein